MDEATSAGAKRAAPARGGGKGGSARRKASGPDLRRDLRDFASARPGGWGHEEWLRFLEDLKERGHNINDRDEIGSLLERERLALALERTPGVGPRRVQTIVERYSYLWRLRETSAEQLARETGIPRAIAERVIATVRG